MGQRKLTNYEQQLVYEAWKAIGRLNSQLIPETYSRLCGMRVHGTTDGKPYVEPQPEIGDGYRVATDEDMDRQDVEIYIGDGWAPKANVVVPHVRLKHFRVPVNPKPEIGEGYRVATEADSLRSDLEEWDFTSRKWKPGFIVGTDTTYRVPVDRIPTDDDARQRPLVMVRDHEDEKWGSERRLVAVSADPDYPFYASNEDSVVTYWRYCRFPYPGE